MPSALERAAARFRRELARQEREATGPMVRAYGEAWQRVSQRVADLQAQIAAAHRAGVLVSPSWLFERDRLSSLQAQIERELRAFGAVATEYTTVNQLRAIEAAGRHAAGLVNLAAGVGPVGIEMPFDILPTSAMQELVGFASDGSPLRELFGEISGGVADRVTNQLVSALAAGLNPRVTARLIRQAFGTGLNRALTIARTETIRAYTEATHRNYLNNRDVVEAWVWCSALDSRTCAACVVGDTVVSGPAIQKVFSRHYTGDVIVIETASGKHLTITPNHPVLTNRGWVAAELLHEGDYVVSSSDSEGAALGVNIDNYHMPTVISEVAKTFGVILAEMKCSPPDFHGDGKGSDVYIVRANRLLGDNSNFSLPEQFKQGDFSFRGSVRQAERGFFFPSSGGAQSAFPGNFVDFGRAFEGSFPLSQWDFRATQGYSLSGRTPFDATDAQTGGNCGASDTIELSQFHFGFAGDIFGGDFGVGQLQEGVALSSIFGSSDSQTLLFGTEQIPFAKDFGQSFAADTEAGSDFLRSFSGQVCLDRILKINVRGFSGHVYNLQTEKGWYASNGIITHNCWAMHGSVHPLDERLHDHPNGRCSQVPQVVPWSKLGFDVSDRRPRVATGAEVFATLTAAEQRTILGPAAFAAYVDGAVSLEQFAQVRHHDDWGDSVQRASLVSLIGQDDARRYMQEARN